MNRVGRGVKVAIAAALFATTVAGCQVATIGKKCTGGVGRDSVNILACKNGRWSKLMTIQQYGELLVAQQAPTTTAPAHPATPPPVSVAPGGDPDVPPTTAAPTTTTSTTTTTTTSTTTTTIPSNRTGLFAEAPMRSWRVNGQGWANVLVGNTAYIGGDFDTATSYDGTRTAPRRNMVAVDTNTGELVPGFVADTDGPVFDLAVSGSTLYLAGRFSTVNGVGRPNLAAVDLGSGAVTSWNPRPNASVNKIDIGGGKLFLGGNFNYIAGSFRNKAGAVSLSTGAVDPRFAPDVDAGVNAIAPHSAGTRIYISGGYRTVNGNPPVTSDFVPGPFDPAYDGSIDVLDADGRQIDLPLASWRGSALDLKVVGNELYAATTANRIGSWDTTTGRRRQSGYCNGDGQAVARLGSYTYGGFHESCDDQAGVEDLTQRLIRLRSNGQRDFGYAPRFDQFWGVRDLGGDAATMIVSGQFNWISDVRVGGFAIYRAIG